MATPATTQRSDRLHNAYFVARRRVARSVGLVESLPVPRVLAAFIVVEWVLVLAAAVVIRHAGWIYYQGGDQLWYYTLGWLISHGQLSQTLVGYLWSMMLAPIARVAGPNLVSAFPVIAVLNVLVLMSTAMLAIYGIAARIGGRLFGYWVLTLWLVLPFFGILYTNAGYHQRYTELLLPQAFGLTAMADFPTMVATLVSVYFCCRVIFSEAPQLVDAVAGGVAAGVAIGIKPATSLFLVGPALAFLVARRPVGAAGFAAGMAPALVTLAAWKARGLGTIPILSSSSGRPTLAAALPLGGLNTDRYFRHLNWQWFTHNIDLLREHFWSGRLIVWLIIAGAVGLFRRSPRAGALVGGWFFAFAFVKGSYNAAGIEDGSLFRVMMPAYPAFVLLLASVPLLVPGAPQRLPSWRPAFASPSLRVRWGLIGTVVLVTAVIPLVAIAAAGTEGTDRAVLNQTFMPVPVGRDLGLTAKVSGRSVRLDWRVSKPLGGPVFYRVWRARTDGLECPSQPGARLCHLTMPEVGVAHEGAFVDRAPPGRWVYRIAVAANWLNDPHYGDPYMVSRPVSVTTR
jgi:hypothetical protein